MRAFLPNYEMVAPGSLAAALELLQREPGTWQPFAGGTDLMVLFEAGKLTHTKFVSLWGLDELHGIVESDDAVTLGALTTYREVMHAPVIQREFAMLAQAARETGGVATQNRGTIGGNIVNASPAADSPPALLVYEAELELRSATGARWIPYAGFHTGYKQTLLGPGEIVSRVRLPRRHTVWREQYRKVGTRKAQAISKVCFAGAVEIEAGAVKRARFALGSVAPLPLRCVGTEAALQGRPISTKTIAEARATMEAGISPISDIRSTDGYRRRVAGNLLVDFLQSL